MYTFQHEEDSIAFKLFQLCFERLKITKKYFFYNNMHKKYIVAPAILSFLQFIYLVFHALEKYFVGMIIFDDYIMEVRCLHKERTEFPISHR